MANNFFPKIKNSSENELINFFKKEKLEQFVNTLKGSGKNSKYLKNNLLKPILKDLYFIYNVIIKTRRISALEFGCGFSSEVICIALNKNKIKYQKKTRDLKIKNQFKNIIIENQKKYLKIFKKRSHYLKNFEINYAECVYTNFNGTYATVYKNLPILSPDFIYLDGPDPNSVKKKHKDVELNTAHGNLFPLSCDILKIEYFLIPGTIIVIDGRGQNAHFLRDNFKRNWAYKYYNDFDMHFFILTDNALGTVNRKQLEFFNNHN